MDVLHEAQTLLMVAPMRGSPTLTQKPQFFLAVKGRRSSLCDTVEFFSMLNHHHDITNNQGAPEPFPEKNP